MDVLAGALAVWTLALATAVARRSWIWFAVAVALGLVHAVVRGGAIAMVRGVHEDAVPGGALLAALGWTALVSAIGAALVWFRRR